MTRTDSSRPFSADQLHAALTEVGGSARADYLDNIVAKAARTPQRPAWSYLERWIPMISTTARPGALSLPSRSAWTLLLLGLLLAAVAAASLIVGSTQLRAQHDLALPPAIGPANNGLIAFDIDGDIWVVEPDGSGRRQLTSGPEWDITPTWSQDGTRIAYWSQAAPEGITALEVMDADGRDVRTLVEGLTLSRWDAMPAWSHDGRYLAYSDRTPAGVDRINVIPVEGGGPTEVASPGRDPSWSPDDRLIGYQSGGTDPDGVTQPSGLTVIAMDGTGARELDRVSGTAEWSFSWPSWDPAGDRISYMGGPNSAHGIFVAAVDGSSSEAIVDSPSFDENWPAWSPDGARIAYGGPSTAAGMYQIYVVGPDGSDAMPLEHAPLGVGGPRWSPDGTRLINLQDGDTEATGSMLIIDASGSVPPVTIPYEGVPNSGWVSWQRLAP